MVTMIYELLNLNDNMPVWILKIPAWAWTIIFIFIWWAILQLIGNFLIRNKIRRSTVVILSRQVLFLTGAIFIFNLLLVPVVLIAFGGMALYCLGFCTIASVLYLIRVDDKERDEIF